MMASDSRLDRDIGAAEGGSGYDGGPRSRGRRPVTDYGSTMVYWMQNREPRFRGGYLGTRERPSAGFIINMLPPLARPENASESIPTKQLHASRNKIKHPVNIVKWTPEGRRLLTGSSSGEFTLWNGTGFNFETIQQAHDVAIRALSYSHNDEWLISGDHDGIIKYWQPNFNNVQNIQGHNDPIRDLAFSPNDSKFVTASDDSNLKIFDFAGGAEDSTLTGHGWDAKSVDWHPTKGLLVSGSKDHLVKLWDPRTGRCLTTLHGHKNTITKTIFERNRGNCFATSARDQTARVFDLRTMRDICLLKGHEKDISTIAWHPVHSNLLSTGGSDGALFHYLLDEPNGLDRGTFNPPPYESTDATMAPAQTILPAHRVGYAHDFAIWSLDWHPLGHILASGSNDTLTRFWSRARPGEDDVFKDRYHIGEAAAEAQGTWDRRSWKLKRQDEEDQESKDELDGLVDQKIARAPSTLSAIPGLPPPQMHGSAFPAQSAIPGVGLALLGAPPPPILPGLVNSQSFLPPLDPNNPPDFATLTAMMKKAGLPPPPLPGMSGDLPPPPPGFNALQTILSVPSAFGQAISNHGDPEVLPYTSNMESDSVIAGGIRKRGPLPSQEESLQMEQKRGRFTKAR